jgi:hypothetical protein
MPRYDADECLDAVEEVVDLSGSEPTSEKKRGSRSAVGIPPSQMLQSVLQRSTNAAAIAEMKQQRVLLNEEQERLDKVLKNIQKAQTIRPLVIITGNEDFRLSDS